MNLHELFPMVEIHPQDAKFEEREVGQVGKKFILREQVGYFKKPNEAYPVKMKITLPKDRSTAYPAGEYVISPSSIAVGDFDSLMISGREFNMVPVSEYLAHVRNAVTKAPEKASDKAA